MLRTSAFLIGSAALAIAGCGGGGGAGAREPGEVAAQYQGEIQSADTAHGGEIFNNLCMSCHGGGAPQLEGLGWDPGRMRQQIREGGGRMPAINESRLSPEDLEAVLAHLTTIGTVTGALPGGDAGGEEVTPIEDPAVEGEPAEEPAEEGSL